MPMVLFWLPLNVERKGKHRSVFRLAWRYNCLARIPEFANSYDYATAYNKAQMHDGVKEENFVFTPTILEAFRTHSDPLLYPDTDWTDLLAKGNSLADTTQLEYIWRLQSCEVFCFIGYLYTERFI